MLVTSKLTWTFCMFNYPDLTTEAKCRELLERYPENVYVKDRLARHLRSQGRNDDAEDVLALDSH
jgi:hypothetical protein